MGLTELLQLARPYVTGTVARTVAPFAAAPLSAGMTALQTMAPVPANAGEQPWYVRDPATGQIIPNQANRFNSAMLQQTATPPSAAPFGNVWPQPASASPYRSSPPTPMPQVRPNIQPQQPMNILPAVQQQSFNSPNMNAPLFMGNGPLSRAGNFFNGAQSVANGSSNQFQGSGLLPKMLNFFSGLRNVGTLNAGGFGSSSVNDPTQMGSFY